VAGDLQRPHRRDSLANLRYFFVKEKNMEITQLDLRMLQEICDDLASMSGSIASAYFQIARAYARFRKEDGYAWSDEEIESMEEDISDEEISRRMCDLVQENLHGVSSNLKELKHFTDLLTSYYKNPEE